MNTPALSVVIPTIMLDSWLDIAINAVLTSDFIDLELLVVHDGVEPDTSKFWMSDPRVRVIHFPERRGLAAGSNAGVAAATAPIVARCDADDVSEPSRFAQQLHYLSVHPNAVAVGSVAERIDELGATSGVISAATGDDIRPSLCYKNTLINSSMMFRKAAIHAAGGYDENLKQMEDYDLALRLSQLGEIANLPAPLVRYRVHNNQMSRGAKPCGPYIQKVLQGRVNLGRSLGLSPVERWTKNSVWRVAQYARYWGLMRPGFER